MKRALLAGLVLSATLCAACRPPFGMLEDVGTDPHPPTVEVLAVAYQPIADENGNTPAPVYLPLEGFTIHLNDVSTNTFLLLVRYTDAGGDVQKFFVRDRDSSLDAQASPAAPEVPIGGTTTTLETPTFFTGTSGEGNLKDILIPNSPVGEHRLEVWAEDSHLSRSAKVALTVNVQL
jgi:hypothetical protein